MTRASDKTLLLFSRPSLGGELAQVPLRRLFRALTRAAIATCAVGCPVRGSQPLDYLGVFDQFLGTEGVGDPVGPYGYERVAHGDPCTGVTSDQLRCAQQFAAASAPVGCDAEPCPNFAVARTGDDAFTRITERWSRPTKPRPQRTRPYAA